MVLCLGWITKVSASVLSALSKNHYHATQTHTGHVIDNDMENSKSAWQHPLPSKAIYKKNLKITCDLLKNEPRTVAFLKRYLYQAPP